MFLFPARQRQVIIRGGKGEYAQKAYSFVFYKVLAGAFITLFSLSSICFAEPELWQGLIAEDTSGNLQTYRIIASVCRNRLQNGLNLGLVALRQKVR